MPAKESLHPCVSGQPTADVEAEQLPEAEQDPEPGRHPDSLSQSGRPPIEPPDAGSCRRYVRQRFAAVLPVIISVLLDAALAGDLAALKVILQMAELEDETPINDLPPHRCKSLEELLMQDWQRGSIHE